MEESVCVLMVFFFFLNSAYGVIPQLVQTARDHRIHRQRKLPFTCFAIERLLLNL